MQTKFKIQLKCALMAAESACAELRLANSSAIAEGENFANEFISEVLADAEKLRQRIARAENAARK